MTLSRRTFFTGLATLIAAPAIVRAESLMKLAPTEIIRAPAISMRMIGEYAVGDDNLISRLDVLYGYQHVRPEWTAVIPKISLDEYSKRLLDPLVNCLAQSFADAVMNGNGAAWTTLEVDGTGSLPRGARERVPVSTPIKLSDLLREARDHQFA